MEKLIYLPKWSDVLIAIYKSPESKRYCQKIAHNVDSTNNHIRAIVKALEELKLVEIVPTKKIKQIYLTEKGKGVALALLNIKSAIDENKLSLNEK